MREIFIYHSNDIKYSFYLSNMFFIYCKNAENTFLLSLLFRVSSNIMYSQFVVILCLNTLPLKLHVCLEFVYFAYASVPVILKCM